MNKIHCLILTSLSLFLLPSCDSKDPTSKFTGTWNFSSGNSQAVVTINKTGKNFSITAKETPYKSQPPYVVFSGVGYYDKEKDFITVERGGETTTIRYNPDDNTIQWEDWIYEKSK